MYKFTPLSIPDIILIDLPKFFDDRGAFLETYKKSIFIKNNIKDEFVQDNHSISQKGVLRGLHYQINPFAQGKLVRVIKGEVQDIMVDIRANSPWFGKHLSINLSEEKPQALWIPAGFAHGFIALKNDTHFVYKVTKEYDKDSERGILYNDQKLAIDWILPETEHILSPKDLEYEPLSEHLNDFTY